MAHEVESMMYVDTGGRNVPWHGLGTRVTEAPDTERALVLAGLNWAIEQRPVYANGQVVGGWKANVRATDGKVLGLVGTKYKPVQNRELANFVDGLLGEGAQIETAGSLQGGARVWLLARLPEIHRLAGDPTVTYLAVSNFHNGGGAVRANIVPVRVVCKNTLNLALRKAVRSWSCRHTGNISGKLDEASRALGLVRDYMVELEHKADVLRVMRISPDAWSDLVAELIPLPKGAKNPGTEERAKTKQKALREKMMAADLTDSRWTAWAAVNAVADFAGHSEPSRKVAQWQENRFAAIVDGHPLLDKALQLLGVE